VLAKCGENVYAQSVLANFGEIFQKVSWLGAATRTFTLCCQFWNLINVCSAVLKERSVKEKLARLSHVHVFFILFLGPSLYHTRFRF
jgi:hypothetical protein